MTLIRLSFSFFLCLDPNPDTNPYPNPYPKSNPTLTLTQAYFLALLMSCEKYPFLLYCVDSLDTLSLTLTLTLTLILPTPHYPYP